jgi:hypothetical protein
MTKDLSDQTKTDENYKRMDWAISCLFNHIGRYEDYCEENLERYTNILLLSSKFDSIVFENCHVVEKSLHSNLPKYKELADYLGISEQAVKQSHAIKRNLMLIGLKYILMIDGIKKDHAFLMGIHNAKSN